MKKRWFLPFHFSGLLGILFFLLINGQVYAENVKMTGDNLDQPIKALISPTGAHLEFNVERETSEIKGFDAVNFTIPVDAANLQLTVSDRTIVRYEAVPVSINMQSIHSGYRQTVQEKERELNAQLETVKAEILLLSSIPANMTSGDLTSRQQLVQTKMPALSLSRENIEQQLLLVREELSRMPQASALGSRISIILLPANKASKNVTIKYSYDLPMCGWEAVYNFEARPDEGSQELVDVRLLAEVWQYTGIDWDNCEITLVTQGDGPREPWPLPEWLVGMPSPKPNPVPMAANADRVVLKSARTETASTLSIKAPPVAPVHANSQDVYASWKLETKGLPEGRTRLQISSDIWKAPLQWLARPNRDDNRVWLYAKYSMPPGQAWPSGTAQYSVNGQSVGSGHFTPKGGVATLYFGPDPRVTVRTTFDKNRQGETGIINTNKTWTWAWTYTLENQHNRPIKVRVERPMPMLGNEDISVSYQNKPEATQDDKEHMLWWLENVPAHGKTVIQHGITIAAPEKLSLLPDVP